MAQATAEQPAPAADSASIEDRVARALGFGPVDEPVVEDDDADDQTEADEEPDDSDEQVEAQADADDGDSELEEVEYDGKSYRVPKELKPALLRNDDYTRKTQEVADRARVWDQHFAAAAAQREFEQTVAPDLEQLRTLQSQLTQFKSVDMDSLDAGTLTRLLAKRDMIRSQAEEIQSALNQKHQQHQEAMAQRRQQLTAVGVEYLRRNVPGWGPDTAKSVVEQARKAGYSQHQIEALDNMTDPMAPVVIGLLAKAAKWDALQEKTGKVTQKASKAPPVVKPGTSNPELSQKMSKLNFRRQVKAAPNQKAKNDLILANLERRFGGR
jgi:hypothetical protein